MSTQARHGAFRYTVGATIGPYAGGLLGAEGDYYLGAKLAAAGSMLSVVLSLFLPGANRHEKGTNRHDKCILIIRRVRIIMVRVRIVMIRVRIMMRRVRIIARGYESCPSLRPFFAASAAA